MELTFTATVTCPWTNQAIDIPLKEGGQNIPVTKDNKVNMCYDMSVRI